MLVLAWLKGTVAWVAASMGVMVVGLVAAPVTSADSCPNAALRVQNHSTELPDCRAYEMVSSSYKQGFAIEPRAFSDDGIVSYRSLGSFAGNPIGTGNNPYLATRSATGWVTNALNPPGDIYSLPFVVAQSPDLRWSLYVTHPLNELGSDSFYLRSPDGVLTRVGKELGGPPLLAGASADLSHVVFQHSPGAGNPSVAAIWEWVGTDNQGLPRPVSVDNTGAQTPGQACSARPSMDGRVVVFASGCGGTGRVQWWARIGGSVTVAVSASECTRTSVEPEGACNAAGDAQFAGAADDGSRVFFTTTQQLVNGDTDQTNDLYACDIPPGTPAPAGSANSCADLTEISGAASGAEVEGVSAISDDGSRAYFVAQGAALADNLGVNDASPVVGQRNLYLWTKNTDHPAGEIKFVAPLGSDSLGQAQLTPDARYLVFSTSIPLVASGPGADTDGGAADMYRYDATTNTMTRLSTSISGSGGNAPGLDASTGDVSAVTPDGSLVVFQTDEALSPRDTDGVTDVYAWHDSHVSLISDGGGEVLWVSPSGRDIFFTTGQKLTAADGDVNGDIYSARVDGGFDLTQPVLCAGDGCQGPQSDAPSLAAPGSGPTGKDGLVEIAPNILLRKLSLAQRRHLAATGKVALIVIANTAGTATATATATVAGKPATVASGHKVLPQPGSATIALTLSKKARAQLKARGNLTVRISVSHSKVAAGRSMTLKLTHAKAKKSSASRSSRGKQVVVRGRSSTRSHQLKPTVQPELAPTILHVRSSLRR